MAGDNKDIVKAIKDVENQLKRIVSEFKELNKNVANVSRDLQQEKGWARHDATDSPGFPE